MTDQNLTEMVFILDRSGSMAKLIDESIGGFNSLIEHQIESDKPDGLRSNITLAIFDTEYDLLYDAIDISKVEKLTKDKFFARGGTALLDAIGRTVNSVGARLARLPEDQRPGQVIVTIMTDGQENSSREFAKSQIKAMIETQTNEFSWIFNYLGANQDSFTEAGALGIAAFNVSNYHASAVGTQASFGSVSLRVNSMKRGRAVASATAAYAQAMDEVEDKENETD